MEKYFVGLHHVAINSPRFQETVAFYQGLGMGIVDQWQGATLLDLGRGALLEIFDKGALADPDVEGGFVHIALGARDVDALFRQCLDLGAREKMAPRDILLGGDPNKPARIAFVYGPTDELIEIFSV